jgi:hypothetical protein
MNQILRPNDLLAPLAPINLYTEPAFLDVVANVYHAGRTCRVRDYVVGDDVFRLLEVDGLGAMTSQRFVDMHESLGQVHSLGLKLRSLPRLEGVAQSAMRLEEFREQPDWQDAPGAPTTLWEGFATWADYLALLQARQGVAEDRRRGRRLAEKVGPLAFSADDRDTDVLPTAFEWKSRRDLSLARPDMLADTVHRRFFHELHARRLLRASTLRGGDGQLLAIWLGAVHGTRWSGWIFGFNPDPSLSKFSVGQQLLYPMLEHSYHSGHSEFDFSIGLEPYKLKFATHVRPLAMAGSLAPADRAARAARRWLARYPWWETQARALRRRISSPPSHDTQAPPARQA